MIVIIDWGYTGYERESTCYLWWIGEAVMCIITRCDWKAAIHLIELV